MAGSTWRKAATPRWSKLKAPSPSAPVRSLRTESPARPCNRPASSRPALRGLPRAHRHHALRPFALARSGPSMMSLRFFPVRDLKPQRRAGIPMPGLHRIDPVPVRAFAAREQEIDRGRDRTLAVDGAAVAKCFAIMSAFRMRPKAENADDVGSGEGHFISRRRVPDAVQHTQKSLRNLRTLDCV